MRTRWQVVVTSLALAAAPVFAQQKGLETSSPDSDSHAVQANSKLSALMNQDQGVASTDLSLGKKLRASGPLIHAFKGGKIAEVPRRALHLVNPFAPAEPGETLERARDLNPRAWSTLVGLHPGGSAFPDATTHEPSLGLLTIHR